MEHLQIEKGSEGKGQKLYSNEITQFNFSLNFTKVSTTFHFLSSHWLRNESRVRIPDSQDISERLPMETFEIKENNLLLEENIHVDENELTSSDE